MVTAELSTLLMDWSTAVIELKLEKVHALLEKEPELLWTPIPHSLDEPDHLMSDLHQLLKLGTSFQPVSAIQYCLIHYKDLPEMSEQTRRYRLLAYLIEQSSLHDLDTRFWGECNNSTLHLVCFLGHLNILELLVQKGVSTTPTNELGFTPEEITSDEITLQYLNSLPPSPVRSNSTTIKKNQVSRTKSVRPNYSTPDRFKLLRELAEESSVIGGDDEKKNTIGLDRQKSDGRFFRKGHVKESQKKVLIEDEEELEKQRAKRQQEVAQLVKKSAVKNNPLYRKLEKRTFTSPVVTSSLVSQSPFKDSDDATTTIIDLVDEPETITDEPESIKRKASKSKRNSKVINSLQKKSYVSTSIFLQDSTANPKVVSPPPVPIVPTTTAEPHLLLNNNTNNDDDQTEEEEEEETPESEYCETIEQQHKAIYQTDSYDDIHMTKHDIPRNIQESEKSPNEYTVESLDISYNPIPLQKGTSDMVSTVEGYLSKNIPHSEESSDEEEEVEIEEEEEEEEEYVENIRGAYFIDNKRMSKIVVAVAEEEVGESSDDADYLSIESGKASETSEDEDIKYTTAEIKRMSRNLLLQVNKMDDEEEGEEENSETDEIQYTTTEIKRFSRNFVPKLDVDEDNDTEDEETYEKLYNYEMYPDEDEDDLIDSKQPDVRSSIIDDSSSEEELEEEGTASTVQFATRMVTPVYKSVMVMSEEDFKEKDHNSSSKSLESTTSSPRSDYPPVIETQKSTIPITPATELTIVVPESSTVITPTFSEQPPQQQLPQQQQEQPSRQEHPSRPDRSDLRKSQQIKKGSRDSKRMSGSQKASWTMSMSSWAAIIDREFNLDELDPNNKRSTIKAAPEKQTVDEIKQEVVVVKEEVVAKTIPEDEGKIEISDEDMDLMFNQGLARTSFDKSRLSLANSLEIRGSSLKVNQLNYPPQNTLSTNTSRNTKEVPAAPQLEDIPRLQSSKSIRRKPIDSMTSSSLNLSKRNTLSEKKFNTMPTISHTARHDHGKLYLHVNGVQDILLPLPKERAYARCVVSDGRFEYMSRYEILSQNINFNYECVIDTHRDMIITISLHVRPDYVMKSRTPFSRFFSSKKKKETLSGYVNKEDGAIGQARFALAHMIPVCQEAPYMAGFHCFNAWYSRSFKERHRQKKKDSNHDVLKVVGNFDVEMLYIPVTNYQQVFPRNLRECEQALRLNSKTE